MLKRLLILVAILVTNCQQNEPASTAIPPAPKTKVAKTADQIADLKTPESMFYDADQDVYFISNINGGPTDVDNNGFISRVNPDTGGNFEPTGTDAVWKITNDKPQQIAKGKDLKAPNGVEVADGKVWVVTFSGNELYHIEKGKKTNVTTLPKGSLDGLLHLSDGSFLVTSWEAKSVYRGKPGGAFAAVIENVNSPADIGYDTRRHRLLIPHFMDNVVSIHAVQ